MSYISPVHSKNGVIAGEMTGKVARLSTNTTDWEPSNIPPVGNVDVPLTEFTVLLINGGIFVFGGLHRDYYRGVAPTNMVWKYKLPVIKWTVQTSLLKPPVHLTSFFINGKIIQLNQDCFPYFDDLECNAKAVIM